MSDLFSVAHIAQLHEIQATRLRRGQSGIGLEIEALIFRLTSGGVAGKSEDVREIQAKRLWDIGVGTELGHKDFAAYLATIPPVPVELVAHKSHFPRLVLVEPRLGLLRLCACACVVTKNVDSDIAAHSRREAEFKEPTWVRLQSGEHYRYERPMSSRRNFESNEVGLSATQGVCALIQHPDCIRDMAQPNPWAMLLPGTVLRDNGEKIAYLYSFWHKVELDWRRHDRCDQNSGSATRLTSD